jgi:subtilisin-like proprotein convertase family protein
VNVDKATEEDDVKEQRGEPPRFAIPYADLVTPQTHGLWESPKPGIQIWRLWLQSPGAKSINLGFTKYVMPPGGQLQLYDQRQKPMFRPFTAEDNKPHQQLWTPPVEGIMVMVEVIVADESKGLLELELTSVNVGYRGWGDTENQTKSRSLSGSCNIDVACAVADDWKNEIRTAAVYSYGGSRLCSGGMINQAVSSNRAKPLFLTAYHCRVNTTNAPSMVVFWNYQTSTCGGTPDGVLADFQTGATFRASSATSDFALVELDSMPDPSWSVGWAGWDRTDVSSTSAVAIHHPRTDEKRISFENDPTSITSYQGTDSPGDGSHLRITDWDLGTTEGGSSGSHLFDQNRRVVGQLHGGDAACGNDLSDWYGRLAISWTGGGTPDTRLSDWLDPDNTEVWNTDTLILNPPVGACCYGFTCSVENDSDCIIASGVYLGDGSSCVNLPAGKPTTYLSGTIDLAIPDNGGFSNAATHTITVTDSFIIGDVNVIVDIDHTFVGDLSIQVSHSGIIANVMARRSGCAADNLDVIFDDEGTGGTIQQDACFSDLVSPPNYRPARALSVFDGLNAAGPWTIKVFDSSSNDVGTLVDWGVQIDEAGQISPCPTQSPSVEKKPFCFSNLNTVDIRGFGQVSIELLQVGDYIRTDRNKYSRVYSFAHRDQSVEIEYIQIHLADLETPLEVSPDHLVYIEGKSSRASQAKIGDNMDRFQVINIEYVRRRGAYAPLTESGSIVVSGIRASNYVGLLDHLSPRTHNVLMHCLSSFRRLTCFMNFDLCKRESYTAGIADWLHPYCGLTLLLGDLAFPLQMLAVAVIVPIAILLYAVEQAFRVVAFLAIGTFVVFCHWNRRSSVSRFISTRYQRIIHK